MDNQKNTLIARPTPSQGEANEGPAVRRKKPYEKPAFLYRAPLEAMAAVCTAGGKGPGVCGLLYS